jgi:hypothetical protein
MPCNIFSQYKALNEVNRTLRVLTKVGFGPLSEPFEAVNKLRGELLGSLGLKIPKPIGLLKLLAGLSPGSVKLFYDTDSGWFTDARETPGAPPVYHHVADDVAMTLLKGELTHELEAELMKPDEYLGE